MTSTYLVMFDHEGTRVDSLPGPPVAELDVLAPMRATAIRVLTQHISDQGRCVVCGSTWPCDRAVQAEHNLAAQ